LDLELLPELGVLLDDLLTILELLGEFIIGLLELPLQLRNRLFIILNQGSKHMQGELVAQTFIIERIFHISLIFALHFEFKLVRKFFDEGPEMSILFLDPFLFE
jgi:hypothetical protein